MHLTSRATTTSLTSVATTRKLLEIDPKTGKYKLSHRVLEEKPEGLVERPRRPRGDRGDRRPRGERGGERRPRREHNDHNDHNEHRDEE